VLLGDRLVERYDLWKPSIDAMGDDVYPRFGALAEKMRGAGDRPRHGSPGASATT
jgi:hypothetical protein